MFHFRFKIGFFASIFVVILGSSSGSLAQFDYGLKIITDEFTKERTCIQWVINNPGNFNGIMLFDTKTPGVFIAGFHRAYLDLGDLAFNMFGAFDDDQVYVKFSENDIQSFPILKSEIDEDLEIEQAFVLLNRTELSKLLSNPTDLRIRFDGSQTRDFTIDHNVILSLAKDFGNQCF